MQRTFTQKINALKEEVEELKKQMLKSQLNQSTQTNEILIQNITYLQQQVDVLIQNQNNILAALCNGINYHPQQHNWTADERSQPPSPVGLFADGYTDFSLFANMPLLKHSQTDSQTESQTDSQTEPPKPTNSYAEIAAKPPTVANTRQINVQMPLASVEPKKKSPTVGDEDEKPAMDNLQKSQICHFWKAHKNGKSPTKCQNGANCKFAHGEKELKKVVPPYFKNHLCKHWSSGRCLNGEGCHFAHGPEQLRQLGVTKESSSNVPSPSKSHQSRRFCDTKTFVATIARQRRFPLFSLCQCYLSCLGMGGLGMATFAMTMRSGWIRLELG
ncbi:hypothetical protein niasHT_002531 [Heterodera trifolii]|uniref:C3H1-type domain-containing protein n=1 Tax=Heterodera trifolii TaxID=157864 RepID=A0ABD2LWK0_9BILA